MSEVICTGKFDYDRASDSPLWVKELESGGHHAHNPETLEY